ncbi:uncharacterized protein F5891DRAFT_1191249 [Suillus fuscotomentosus]|uniref:Uncharacterized protein n=1 Tax=Suillus fuscotomentosus TaxID=1912939 RepID=A0AAD4E1E5_9AGAM|nr:uncharacterized protein F5891DRAFT_1191249 [Suillus fuscotomentosus]KAG1897939.1 hypothetical protein F5891DRAFT_1191249 [Suillus fuscotomentosus]
MHIPAINAGDTLIPLWCGTFRADPDNNKSMWPLAVLMKETWKKNGSTIGDATPFLPGSFDRPPHNPAEKINSGFKAWEWLLYLYRMGLAALFGVLPDPYWTNLCHLVSGMCLMQQYHITRTDLMKAHEHLLTFAHDFETIYYQRHIDRLHFVRPWIHSTTHIPSETITKGPPICSSQWTMECTIGNLAQEICLHNSSIYANLSRRAAHHCQINAIKAIILTIEPEQNSLPGVTRPRKWLHLAMSKRTECPPSPSVTRWARLRLPNGQVARSAWKENAMSRQPHIARNVKLSIDGEMSIAEVLFYFNMTIHDETKTFALVPQFSPPHAELLRCSFQTVVACHYCGDTSLKLIEVSTIQSVVAMVLHRFPVIDDTLFYLIERPGLDIIQMGGSEDTDEQGNPVSAQHAKAIRQLMLSSFRQLETQGLAPESIGQALLQVLHWLTHTLCKQFLELRLCADNWKSMKLMIDNYSQWYNYHVKRRGTKRIKSEDIPLAGDELCESSVDTLLPSISTSDPLSSSDYLDPMIDPALQEPPTKKQRLEDAENTTSEVLPQLEIPLLPAEIDEPALPSLSLANEKQTGTLNVEVKNPLAGFVFKPATTTSSAPTPFLSRPSRMPPSVADVASLAVKMELVATENTITKTANMISNTQPVKKLAKNGHQQEPASAFALYWDDLSTSMKEEYKSKALAQARSSSTQQAVDREDAINIDE